MNKPLYKKGNILTWTGFLLSAFFKFLGYFSSDKIGAMPSIKPLIPLFNILVLVGIVLMIWGAVLALKSKNRTLWWLLLIPILNIIGLIIIFALRDKSSAEAATIKQSIAGNNSNKQIIDYIAQSRINGMTDEQIRESLLNSGWQSEDLDKLFNQ